MFDLETLPTGKGVYLWQTDRIMGGNPGLIADELEDAGVSIACLKVHDGTTVKELDPVVHAIRSRGIAVASWGYNYLKWSPSREANAAINAIRRYNPAFYLMDAESYAKGQYAGAKTWAVRFRSLLPDFPVGMNSYWYPPYHPTLPWYTLRSRVDYDCPQVYSRNGNPIGKLQSSKLAYSKMTPKLPYAMVAGDMYLERGIKPTPQDVWDFMTAAKEDPEIKGVIMWSMDQAPIVPELWATFKAFEWTGGGTMPPPPPPNPIQPLYRAVVNTSLGLRVRSGPSVMATHLYSLRKGDAVTVWEEQKDSLKRTWARIDVDKQEWVAAWYLTKI